MSGYRESSFDPGAGSGNYGPPIRPFNWVQWTGVAFVLVGVAVDLFYLAGRAGLVARHLDSPSIGVSLPLIGAALVSSRRQPGGGLSPATRRKRLVIVAVGLMVAVAAMITILVLKGA